MTAIETPPKVVQDARVYGAGANALLAWASVLGIVGVGYGALAAVLAGTGREAPTPRRAVRRTRAAVADLRALHARRTKPG